MTLRWKTSSSTVFISNIHNTSTNKIRIVGFLHIHESNYTSLFSNCACFSKFYNIPVGMCNPLPLICDSVLLYFRSPKGGCYSKSDDLFCSCLNTNLSKFFVIIFASVFVILCSRFGYFRWMILRKTLHAIIT